VVLVILLRVGDVHVHHAVVVAVIMVVAVAVMGVAVTRWTSIAI